MAGLIARFLGPTKRASDEEYSAWNIIRDAVRGQRAGSGVRVNPGIALTLSPWFKGINLISSIVGKVPLHVYRREGRGRVRARDHYAYRLVRTRPNPWHTAFPFRQTLQAHALSRGNGYALIVRDGAGRPLELWPMNPDATAPVVAGGELHYETTFELDGRATRQKLRREDVLHIHGLSFDGTAGYSIWELAREALGEAIAQRDYTTAHFKNGNRPAVVLEVPQTLPKTVKDAIVASWRAMYAGVDNAGKTAVLDGGMKANILGQSNEDAQLIESRRFSLVEIANFLNLPPHKVGSSDRVSYSSLEEENRAALSDSYDPWLIAWEQESAMKLLSEEEQAAGDTYLEFERGQLLQADTATRYAAYQTAVGGPWMPPNEARERENLPPVAGGDALLIPLNTAPGGDEGDPPPEPDPVPDPDPPANNNPSTAEEVLNITRALQQVYVAVVNDLVTAEEARAIVNRLGAGLAAELPEELRGDDPPPADPPPDGDDEDPPPDGDDGDGDEPPPDQPDPEEVAAFVRDIVRDAAARMVRRLAVHAGRAAAAGSLSDFTRPGFGAMREHRPVIVETLANPLAAWSALLRREVAAGDVADYVLAVIENGLVGLSEANEGASLSDRVAAYFTAAEQALPDEILRVYGAES